MLRSEHRSEPLEVRCRDSEEPALSYYACQAAGSLEGHEGFLPSTILRQGDSSVSSASTDEMFLSIEEAGHVSFTPHADLQKEDSCASCLTDVRFGTNAHEAGHESAEPFTDLRKEGYGRSTSSTDKRFDPSVSELGNIDTSTSSVAMDVDIPAGAPVQQFPGFVETHFSMPHNRYFHKQKTAICVGFGSFAIVRRVYWFNPRTGDLEPRIAKSYMMEMGPAHSDGGGAFHEKAALQFVAGVPGVVGYRDIIEDANGAIHLIMEDVNGVCLTMRIDYRSLTGLGLTWLQIRLALKDLAQVLADCHKRGLVHGDIKPDNIMSLLAEDGITLIDFGSASMWNGRGYECKGGTMSYTAPESFLSVRWNDGDACAYFPMYGPSADWWAYGLTAFRLLTGSSLFKCAEDDVPPDEDSGVDDWEDWRARRIVDLQADWADVTESRPIHATFREKLQQLAGASEEFQRAGVDFLWGLLRPDPAQRFTAEKVLHHPFLTSPFVSVPPDSMPPEIKSEVTLDTTLKRRVADMCDVLMKKHMG